MSNWRDSRQPLSSIGPEKGRGRGSRGASAAVRPSAMKGQMQHIASVSRSSGLEKDGDALKDFKIQEEYREYIQGKLNEFWKDNPPGSRQPESEVKGKRRVEVQENILILLRKLREGIVSSGRRDIFALEVYESSLYLSVLFYSPRQTASVIPHLISGLYISSQSHPPNRLSMILISLLHHLVSTYPSQSTYDQYLESFPTSFLPRRSLAHIWISAVASSLRTRNYIKFEELTTTTALAPFLEGVDDSTDISSSLVSLSISPNASRKLIDKAFCTLVESLRVKASETAWLVIRSAYREFWCDYEETREWLSRSLHLHPVMPQGKHLEFEQWLQTKRQEDHLKPKAGSTGRWIVSKFR